jgi:hypothetical protein
MSSPALVRSIERGAKDHAGHGPPCRTTRDALAAAAARLAKVSETPRLDADLLMAHALDVSREDLLLKQLEREAPAEYEAFLTAASRTSRSPTSSAGAPSGRSSSRSARAC